MPASSSLKENSPDRSSMREWEESLARFGLSKFRSGQKEVISAVMSGEDCVCIMPTGGGKSLCFQLPAVARTGTVLVVSPLIALMKDQVDTLLQRGISAACINSNQSADEQNGALRDLTQGKLDLLYVAPERLRSPRFVEALGQVEIQLLAIDEAHCISQWGHDFRPDYARLGKLRERIDSPQTIALTATATQDVQKDIVQQLELTEPKTFVTGFSRENLYLEVITQGGINEKNQLLLDFVQKTEGAGIIYASTRKKCEEIVAVLQNSDRRVGHYHGGMLPEDRKRIQEDFMAERIDLIVATNAFGMGIDKPNIRFVVHYNLPGTLEAYYQEAGRAGRDGLPSKCLLLFSHGDRFIQEFFIENAYPSRKIVEQVYEYLRSRTDDPIEITLQQIKEELGLSIATEGISVCEQLLEKAGAIERLDTRQNHASIKLTGQYNTFVTMLPREARNQRKVLRRIEELVGDIRDERVYFHPRQLVDEKLNLESVTRAIRQLCDFEFFDYIPPFRGRAIHVVDRSRRFSSWQIDFAEMKARKEQEFAKLQTMIDYATSHRCRQVEILEYFGDREIRACHSCDGCSAHGTGESQIPQKYLPGVYHAVRIALSGVARSKGRYGRSLIVQMLWGSTAAKLKKTGMQKLTTYGMLKGVSQTDVDTLLEQLINCNLVRQTEKTRFRPTTELTQNGSYVMRGETGLPPGFHLDESLARQLAYLFPDADAVVSEKQHRTESYHPTDEVDSESVNEPNADKTADETTADETIADENVTDEAVTADPDSQLSWSEDEPEFEDDRDGETASEEVDAADGSEGFVDHDEVEREVENVESSEEELSEDDQISVSREVQLTLQLLEAGFTFLELVEIRRMSIEEAFCHLEMALEAMYPIESGSIFNESERSFLLGETSVKPDGFLLPADYFGYAADLLRKFGESGETGK